MPERYREGTGKVPESEAWGVGRNMQNVERIGRLFKQNNAEQHSARRHREDFITDRIQETRKIHCNCPGKTSQQRHVYIKSNQIIRPNKSLLFISIQSTKWREKNLDTCAQEATFK